MRHETRSGIEIGRIRLGPGEGRSARFERVFCPAAIAPAVAQDAVDDARVGNRRTKGGPALLDSLLQYRQGKGCPLAQIQYQRIRNSFMAEMLSASDT